MSMYDLYPGGISEEKLSRVAALSYDPLVEVLVGRTEAGDRHVEGRYMMEIVDITHKYNVSILDIDPACEMFRLRREIEALHG